MPDDNTQAVGTESKDARLTAARQTPFHGPTLRVSTDLDTLDAWIDRHMLIPADLRPLDSEDESAGGWAYETDSGKNRRQISAYLFRPGGERVEEYARFTIERLSVQRCKLFCESSPNWKPYLFGILRPLSDDYPETAAAVHETLIREEPIHRAEYAYALALEPQTLPPVVGHVVANWVQGGDPAHPLELQLWGASRHIHVDAETVMHVLSSRLYFWHRKAFVQPVGEGGRWHLQFRDPEKVEPDDLAFTWLPGRESLTPGAGGIVSGVHMPGFSVYIPPGETPPKGHSFFDPHPHMKQFSLALGALPPWVRLIVTRIHASRCQINLSGSTGAATIVIDDLMKAAENLWGSLAENGRVRAVLALSPLQPPAGPQAVPASVSKEGAPPTTPPKTPQRRARPMAENWREIVATFKADHKAGRIANVERWARSRGTSARNLQRWRDKADRETKPAD